MKPLSKPFINLPSEQEAIRAKCFHPSGTFVEFPKEDVETSIPTRFEKIVRMYPGRIAVKTRTQTFTYDELNAQANRLAHELLTRRGMMPEPVGLFVNEWSTLVVAHLAVLKAGKFSVALDPMAEVSRSTHIAGDSGFRVMIVDENTATAATKLVVDECVLVSLNALRSDLSDRNPGCPVQPEANAYLRYTSGSTGSAKGAIKTHRHALRDTMDFVNEFHLCPEDRVTIIGFASIGKHLLKALLTGACFCPLDARKEGLVHLADWLRRERTTAYYSFPTALRYFFNDLTDSEILPDLRLIELEGEPVYRSDLELIKRHVSPDCIVVNTLSSAETGNVSMYFVDAKTPVKSERLPVGYPMDGVDVLILDENGHSLGFDQVGEVAVRSSSLSAGYWGKPDVTRQKFVVQPDDGATCIYRTGDLGRLSPDGCLHLLGRKDFQVKIRSFRVDVTEVETALMGQGDIRGAAVAEKNDRSGNTTLVAYVVPRHGSEPSPDALRAFLKGNLPDYMIPAQFVLLDRLPMMSTGKVNRRALPEPGNRQTQRNHPIIASRSPVEMRLAQIWAHVLSMEEVGIHDNFFELGGHSLVASQVVSRVLEQFGLEIPVQSLLQASTIAEMAGVITKHQQRKLDLLRSEGSRGAVLDEAGGMGGSVRLEGCRETQLQGGMPGLHQGSLDGYAAAESEKEDGREVNRSFVDHSMFKDDLNERLAELSPAKRALLEQRLKATAPVPEATKNIPPRPTADRCPLSFAQQRLWFLAQIAPGSTTYNVRGALRITGRLDHITLERSLNEIIRRHEALRTTFSVIEGEPLQLIAPSLNLRLSLVDLSGAPEAHREKQVRRLAKEEAHEPFDLIRGPLVRAKLIHLADEDHVLLLTMHHIVSDGWSMGVLYRELSALYEALSQGKPSPLAELPVQYGDFALWQRNWLQGEELARQLAYWKGQLEGASFALNLFTDHPRPAEQTHRGKSQTAKLSEELTWTLKALSRKQGCTLFMTLLAAFKTLLFRYTGQEDMVVGAPIANRNLAQIERLIGFFVNTLVLRTNVSGNPTFAELLGRVREVALEAYSHQDLPFEKLVEEIQPERSLGYSPLFQVMFALQNSPGPGPQFEGLRVSSIRVGTETAKFDLTLSMHEEADGLRATLQYNTDLFDTPTISGMLRHFQVLLEAIAANPEQRISDLPIFSAAEKHQLLVEWNNTRKEYPRDKCIHHLFAEQVERSPDDIAAVFQGQALIYRELNDRANQIAHYLQKLGVGPDVFVGICLERSLEMVVAMLAVLKAGGAYVPLDPSYPKARLAFILKDTGAAVLVTQSQFIAQLPEMTDAGQPPTSDKDQHQAPVIGPRPLLVCLDQEREQFAKESSETPISAATAENLAYVMYTSGSTGQPKGVLVPHRAVIRLLVNTDYVQLHSSDVIGQASNSAFDACTFEIWGALLHGGKLVGIPTEVLLSPRDLAARLEKHRITVLFLTTALFNELVDRIPSALSKLRCLLFGGENADPQRVRKLVTDNPPQHLLHVYGPTETTTFASWYMVENLITGTRAVPIGRPIANSQIFVLDKFLNPVPVGVPGELHIGGHGVARGYLNRPAVTAEKFILHPFSDEPGARLYKTGDLGRYLPDGNIEFLGRLDDQVKIRGFRVEPGEIQSLLAQIPGVQQSVVLERELEPGRKQLVAYVVRGNDVFPPVADLRRYLKENLPDFMMPSAFVFVESLPLTTNGKVDRNRLPPADSTRLEREEVYTPPCTVTEKKLAAIWREVLKSERIGIHDNFFQIGGHSLLAIRMMSRVREVFGVDLPLRQLFEASTIVGLAGRIEAKGKANGSGHEEDRHSPSSLVRLQPGNNEQPVFFLPGGFGGEEELSIYARLAHHVGPDYAFYGLRSRSADGIARSQKSLKQMAADYIRDIRSVQPRGPYFLMGECIGGVVAYEIACQLDEQGEKVALLALIDTHRPTKARYFHYRARQVVDRISSGILNNYYLGRLPYHWQKMRLAHSGGKFRYLLTKVKSTLAERAPSQLFYGPSSDIHSRQIIRDSYIEAIRRYTPSVYRGRVVLFVSETSYRHDPFLGWARSISGGIEFHEVYGNHDTYIREHVEKLGAQLKECLDQARCGV